MNMSCLTMHEFYKNVLDDFANRLFNKYNQKDQGLDSQIIDQIKTKVANKMKTPEQMWKRVTQPCRNSSHAKEETQSQCKVQIAGPKKQIEDQVKKEEEIDYANAFSIAADDEVKKENENTDADLETKNNLDNLDDEKEQEEQRQKTKQLEKIKNNICIHIVGTYEPSKKKHVAKDESTRLELDNVFVKFRNKNEEVYMPKLICDFGKISD